ncbi:unnamed protein product [Arabis nemorensis]|uniref:Uncharacterized protein n=1 Tax=Arabis nemorensis TaxID=586526 RepID=A0A565AZ93_9BRAS|nr:unnamed protein product [Arabis nemorensis]
MPKLRSVVVAQKAEEGQLWRTEVSTGPTNFWFVLLGDKEIPMLVENISSTGPKSIGLPSAQAHEVNPIFIDPVLRIEAHGRTEMKREDRPLRLGSRCIKAQMGSSLGLKTTLDAKEIIFPLKNKIEQRISKALAVKKKIEHSPFRGCRIHKHASLAKEDPVKGESALNGASFPSSSKTGPDGGQTSRKFKDPVVKGKPLADA